MPACLPFSDKFLRELLFCIKFGHFAISFKQVLLNSSSSIFRNYQVCNNTHATLIQEQTQVPIVVSDIRQSIDRNDCGKNPSFWKLEILVYFLV